MTRKEISALKRRIEGLKRRYAAGVCLVVPDAAGGFNLICSAYSGNANTRQEMREESHFDSVEAARLEFDRFSREHPAARGESPALVVVDV